MKAAFIVLLLGLAAFGVWFVPRAWLGSSQEQATRMTLTIERGTPAQDVADLLERNGIIDSSFGYLLYGLFDAATDHPRAGDYTVRPGMSYRVLARIFAIGPARDEIALKVIEGWTIDDEANLLKEQQIDSKVFYNASKVDSWKSDFEFLRALPNGTTLEGYLFPETYRVWRDQLPQSLIQKQLAEFGTRATRVASEAKKQGRTVHEVVILASIVEKEVANPEDRAIVAGIFWNRLQSGMPLQSDATVNYVTNAGRTRPTLDDLATASPYNTYKNKGLPPGPISNPGADALEAALNPAKTAYHYFLTDAEGKTYFARTFEEHQRNREKAFGR